jgi:hypothetical protein
MTMLRDVRVIAVLCCVIAAALTITDAAAERRVALVIGNSTYTEAPLRNPVNDAREMARVLRDLHFDVILLENADRVSMQRASLEFGRKLKDDAVGLFYFAGHGMQVRGVNYLIPISAQVTTEEEVEVEAMDVNYVLARMAAAKNQFNIVILDACRNNPFERAFRSSTSGLAAISAPRGTLIAYATAPGSVAADGQGVNGLYTGELVAALATPNLPLEQTFKQARAQVVSKSGGRQTPWESSSVIGNFVFRPEAVAPPVDAADITLWDAIKDSSEPADYRAYLEAQPKGVYAALARRRIEVLTSVRDEQISRVAREAADKAAAEALAKTKKLEAEAAKADASAGRTAPVATSATMDTKNPQEYVKKNWAAMEKAVRAHFRDPENTWFYNGQVRPLEGARLSLGSVSYYDTVVTPGKGIEVVVLLQGSWPFARWVQTGGQAPFTIFSKYSFRTDGGDLVVTEFLPISKAEMIAKSAPKPAAEADMRQ